MILTKKLVNPEKFYACLDNYIIGGKYSLAKKTLDYFESAIPKERYDYYNSMLIKKLAERGKGILVLSNPKKVIRTRGIQQTIKL